MTQTFSMHAALGGPRPLQPVDPPFLFERVETFEQLLRDKSNGINPLKGRTPGSDAIRLRSNDYLCLAGDQRIIDAEIAALAAGGHGDSVSRIWSQHQNDTTRCFETRIAAYAGAQDAVVCSSGYTANVGLIQALTDPATPVYLDMKAHRSLWEGVVSARAVGRPFRHNDAEHLARLIERHGPGLVVVDALYSTDGAICRLPEFVRVAEYHGCALIVDETHSFGAQGEDGEGLVAAQGLADRVHFRTIGLSKAAASRGGVVLCSKRNAEFVRYRALPLIFSTSVLPHEIAGYEAVLDIFKADPWRRQALHRNHAYLKAQLAALGYDVGASDAQIISLEPGEPLQLLLLRDALESRGVFGSVFVPPATPDKRCMLRFTLNCNLSGDDLDHVVRVCRDVRDEVRMSEWRSTLRVMREAQATIARTAELAPAHVN